MDQRHFEIALISLFASALVAGVDAALQAVPGNGSINLGNVAAVGAVALVTTLLPSLKALYQQSPNQPPDGLAVAAQQLAPVALQVLVNLLAPKPVAIVPQHPVPAPAPAVLFQPRPVGSVGATVPPDGPASAAATDAPTK